MDIFVLILPLLAGWLLDKLIGDPFWLPHPIVGFGKLISFCEKRWNKGKHRVKKGACTAVVLIVFIYGASALLIHGLYAMNLWIGVAVSAVLIFYCLAGTTLINEVRMVFMAADHSLEEGRRQVSRIVGPGYFRADRSGGEAGGFRDFGRESERWGNCSFVLVFVIGSSRYVGI